MKICTAESSNYIEISLNPSEPTELVTGPVRSFRFKISVNDEPIEIDLTSDETQEMMKTLALFVRQYFGKFIS